MEKKPNDHSKRSEEVSDIIDRMPVTFGRWLAIAIIIFTILLSFFGWIIKYPDTITGVIRINSNITPVRLVANSSGKLQIINLLAQDSVKEGQYLAVIQNPAKTEDVVLVLNQLRLIDVNNGNLLKQYKHIFPDKISLGELNMKYYTFLSALKNSISYQEENIFEQQRISLSDGIKWRKIILKETDEILNTTKENKEIVQKWFEKFSSLNNEIVTTYEYEVDRSRTDYLTAKQNEQNLQKETTSIRMQIDEYRNKLNQLSVEKREKERQLLLELLSSYHDLNDNIKLWEQKYVLKSPFNGKVDFLKFWVNNQFVQSGENIFSIIPRENKIIAQMNLPSHGAGKVKEGNRVSIKLENYPYMEFGTIDGIVKSISLITQESKSGENNLDTYLVLIELPKGLTTNYGEILDFKYEIGGIGDIIIKERRLIERLFDNLKSKTK